MPNLLIMVFIIIGMIAAMVSENVEKTEISKSLNTVAIFFYGLAMSGILMNIGG